MMFVAHFRQLLTALALLACSCPVCAATFNVSNKNDTGSGSLRQAILDANANPGPDTINFQILGFPPYTISPASALPPLTESVVLDGTTQGTFNGTPVIELNGSNAG